MQTFTASNKTSRATFKVSAKATQGSITLKAKKALGIEGKTTTKKHFADTGYQIEANGEVVAFVESTPWL